MNDAKRTPADMQGLILQEIAKYVKMNLKEVKPQSSFADYGLSSLQIVAIMGDLEKSLGKRLSPTLAWDQPTIQSLAQYLAENANRSGRD